MARIKTLDASTILKLAAGEIIDRPVSIAKELIENALDAGATRIKLEIVHGGISEISIEDNGEGMSSDDIESSIIPHATSKLSEFSDLEQVLTMGFRGEALASIAEVTHLKIHTFNGQEEIGICLEKQPGKSAEIFQKARNKGTRIQVSHLFKNIPVRFRFLKSPAAEGRLITQLVQQFALHYPSIAFELVTNGASFFSTSGQSSALDVFSDCFNLAEPLEFSKQTQDIRVWGVMSAPNQTFKQRNKCWFSVNGRLVKSPLFFKAIDQALIDIIPKQTYPAIICHIDCPASMVDINIHPKKEDVKFACPEDVFLAIKRAIKYGVLKPAQVWTSALSVLNNAEISKENIAQPESSPHQDALSTDRYPTAINPLHSSPLVTQRPAQTGLPVPTKLTPLNNGPSVDSELKWGILQNKYIVILLPNDIMVFDQHAVHERILYDRYTKDFEGQGVVSMPLLVPEYITVAAEDMGMLDEMTPLFRSMGIDFDRFDATTWVIREIPQFFTNINLSEWVNSFINEELIHHVYTVPITEKIRVLQMKACKAAVKAGQRLHDLEVRQLVMSCMDNPTQYTCPHGRPLYLKISSSELDAMFLRK
jgi:DNA mismatch repair protein MutL